VGEEVVSPCLWSKGIRQLDAIAISHPHSDRIGGMPSIIANFRPKELWYGLDSPVPEFAALLSSAKLYDVALHPHLDHAGVQCYAHSQALRSWEPSCLPQLGIQGALSCYRRR
jgi:competence protein ComEC